MGNTVDGTFDVLNEGKGLLNLATDITSNGHPYVQAMNIGTDIIIAGTHSYLNSVYSGDSLKPLVQTTCGIFVGSTVTFGTSWTGPGALAAGYLASKSASAGCGYVYDKLVAPIEPSYSPLSFGSSTSLRSPILQTCEISDGKNFPVLSPNGEGVLLSNVNGYLTFSDGTSCFAPGKVIPISKGNGSGQLKSIKNEENGIILDDSGDGASQIQYLFMQDKTVDPQIKEAGTGAKAVSGDKDGEQVSQSLWKRGQILV